LLTRFPKLPEWEEGSNSPTMKQLGDFAKATNVPFGFLFLPEPPIQPLPINDFRTLENRIVSSPSTALLDTIYTMQRRQAWLRDERCELQIPSVPFVGDAELDDDPSYIGREMRRALGLVEGWASKPKVRTWEDAIRELKNAAEINGVIVVINGVVGNNTRRRLNIEEFRGFALVDEVAPLIFVNGADSKSAQMFTLAHELAHLWLGSPGGGLSGFPGVFPDNGTIENFCNMAAAEFLVPEAEIKKHWKEVKRTESPFIELARLFKVSPVVCGRRAMDLGLIERDVFFGFYNKYISKEFKTARSSGGGDFYANLNNRVGSTFALQVMRSALSGRIGFKQAYDLTGLSGKSFHVYAQKLGVLLP